MRFKYYLRGCGLGILFTTLILMIGFHRHKTVKMSDWEIIQRASELGMVMEDESQEPEASQKELTEQTENSEKSAEPAEEVRRPVPPMEQQREEENKPELADETKSPLAVPQEDGSVMLIVRDGDVCRAVAAELYRTKIVNDAEEFRKFMGENGYSNQIRNGTYIFTQGLEYRQIAEILTNRR